MSEFLDKLTSYNLFNYLLPGVVFSVLSDSLLSTSLIQDDVFVGVFLYYFIGLVLSRVGSVVIEPLLKVLRFIRFEDYPSYLNAETMDKKIAVLQEASNTYRTLLAGFVVLSIGVLIEPYFKYDLHSLEERWRFIPVLLMILFAFGFRKQTQFIVKRIQKVRDNSG